MLKIPSLISLEDTAGYAVLKNQRNKIKTKFEKSNKNSKNPKIETKQNSKILKKKK